MNDAKPGKEILGGRNRATAEMEARLLHTRIAHAQHETYRPDPKRKPERKNENSTHKMQKSIFLLRLSKIYK
jgi:hypothetical protein